MRLIDPIELKRAISVAAMSNNHKTLEQIIDEQPTIEERKTGKWIIEPHEVKGMYIHRCAMCMNVLMVAPTNKPKFSYCPNCGARMERRGMTREEIIKALEESICSDPYECIFGMYRVNKRGHFCCFAERPNGKPNEKNQGCIAIQAARIMRGEGPSALHDLLQDAIDAGIITETQASRLMDITAEDNT